MGESQWQNPNGIFCRVPRPLPPTEGVEERRTHLGAEAPKAVPGAQDRFSWGRPQRFKRVYQHSSGDFMGFDGNFDWDLDLDS